MVPLQRSISFCIRETKNKSTINQRLKEETMRKPILIVLLALSVLGIACSQKSGDDTSGSTNTPSQTTSETVGNGDEQNPTINNNTTTSDAGAAVQDSGSPDAAPKVPTNQAECIAACEAAHPEGKVKADAITACWTASCDPACTFMPDRLDHNVGPENAPTVCGVPELPILVPSPSCAQCTQDNCCTQWAECFSGLQADCTLLNQCATECWTKFAQ